MRTLLAIAACMLGGGDPVAKTTLIGDSLAVGDEQYLKAANSDVKGGRTSADGVLALKRKLRAGDKTVVLELGSNDGSAAELRKSLRRARRIVGDRRLIAGLVGPGVKDSAAKNRVIKNLADDTFKSSNFSDGIHPANYKERARRIKKKIRGGTTTKVRKTHRPPSSDRLTDAGSLQDAYGRLARIKAMFDDGS